MTALLAKVKSETEADALIQKWIEECAEGVSDRERDALALARRYNLNINVVQEFADARLLRPTAEPEVEAPSIVPQAEVLPPPPKPRLIRRPLRRVGPQIDVGQTVSEKPDFAKELGEAIERKPEAKAQPKPAAEEHGGLPAVIPITKPLSDERVSRWDDAMAAMNEEHAVIENFGGKAVIASWEPSPLDLNRRMIAFQGKESFLLRYSNRSVTLEASDGRGNFRTMRMALATFWLEHRDRRQYRGVTFRPGDLKVVGECLNLWQGWGVVPKPGDWALIRKHIEEVIAGGNAEFAEYVIRWIAWGVQNPAAQAEVALVLIGFKGTGKGTLVRCSQRLFGAHAFQVTSREEVIGKFNGHLQDCVLFVADEAYWGGQAMRRASSRNDYRANATDRAKGLRSDLSSELPACGDASRTGMGYSGRAL